MAATNLVQGSGDAVAIPYESIELSTTVNVMVLMFTSPSSLIVQPYNDKLLKLSSDIRYDMYKYYSGLHKSCRKKGKSSKP